MSKTKEEKIKELKNYSDLTLRAIEEGHCPPWPAEWMLENYLQVCVRLGYKEKIVVDRELLLGTLRSLVGLMKRPDDPWRYLTINLTQPFVDHLRSIISKVESPE